MSIASAITNAQQKVANAYDAVDNKGGTLPATQDLSNLSTAINSIPTSSAPTLDSLTITPTTSQQSITPPSGVDGYDSITVNAVTSSIDSDIVASNIKSGVNILGVNGSVTELKGETRTVSITSTSGNTFTPSSGKNGITSIKCSPTNKSLTITPSTSSQSKSVPSGYSGYGTITVNAVTSSIDSNIIAGNIKSGVSILGVTGSYQGGVTPSGTLNIISNGTFDVTNYASADVSVTSAKVAGNLGLPVTYNIYKDDTAGCLVFISLAPNSSETYDCIFNVSVGQSGTSGSIYTGYDINSDMPTEKQGIRDCFVVPYGTSIMYKPFSVSRYYSQGVIQSWDIKCYTPDGNNIRCRYLQPYTQLPTYTFISGAHNYVW